MTTAGELEIRLTGDGASIASTRPLGLAQTLAGRAPSDAVQLIPLVYGICGMAQGVAAARAFERAMEIGAAVAAERGRDLLVMAETAREHLLRIAEDWARAAGAEPDQGVLKRIVLHDLRWRTALKAQDGLLSIGPAAGPDLRELEPLIAELTALIADVALGEPPGAWLERGSRAALAEWARERRTLAAKLMARLMDDGVLDLGAVPLDALPALDDGVLAGRLLGSGGAAFAAEPSWDERPRETTPLARMAAHPLIASLASAEGFGLGARLAARLAELAWLPARMQAAMTSTAGSLARPDLPPGTGVAQVEAARGRLVHAVTVDGGKITAYRILAPTEWNLHPQGAAARALMLVAASGRHDRAALAELMVSAFDPCVACKLEVA